MVNSKAVFIGAVVILLAAVLACAASAAEHAHGEAAAARNVLSLDVYATGATIDLLTAETTGRGEAPALWYRRSPDAGRSWSQPVRVDVGMPAPHHPHRSNDPQIASNGRQVIAVWAGVGRGFRSSGPMVTALSSDGGRTWTRGPNPADDHRPDGHGFADLISRAGRFHLTWLDSRSGAQGVRYAQSDNGGATWSANTSVQSGSCECCWNTLLPARDRTLYLLFRGKGPRDMGIAASRDDGNTWRTLGRVGAFTWQIEACPHTGGALASSSQGKSDLLHSVVWTGKAEERGVHYFSSADGGAHWKHGTRLGGEFAQRSDLAARGAEVVAVWDETIGKAGGIFLARSKNRGAEWSKPMRLSSENANAIYPRVVATASNFIVLWTETIGSESKLRIILMN